MRALAELTVQDIEALIAATNTEHRTLEFKRELPARTVEGKKEFVHDVVSFANAAGGDMLFGVESVDGVPTRALGVDAPSFDDVKLWMESVIRDNVAPRVPGVDIGQVVGFERGPVVVLRIPRSWAGPHMAQLSKGTRFFSRTTAGKYEFDVAELRNAFQCAAGVPERLRSFRDQRLALLLAGEGPTRLQPGPKAVLHVVPLTALDGVPRLDLQALAREYGALQPLGEGGVTDYRFNLDGFLTSTGRSTAGCRQHVQAFRSGAFEYVNADFGRHDDEKLFNALWLEGATLGAIARALAILRTQLVPLPAVALLSLLSVRGYAIPMRDGRWREEQPGVVDRDTVILPDIVLETFDVDLRCAMKPAFDTLWQASGWPRSFGYDEHGCRHRRGRVPFSPGSPEPRDPPADAQMEVGAASNAVRRERRDARSVPECQSPLR